MKKPKNYDLICELTWGGIPVDISWAINTTLYKEMEYKLFNKNENRKTI